MRNILYDEKMAGTIHIAVGASYPKVGGTNVSSLHWDLIKDLRKAAGSSSTARSSRRTAPG